MASAKPKKRTHAWRRAASASVRTSRSTQPTHRCVPKCTAVKNVEKVVLAGDKVKALKLFAKAQSVVDTVADKGIFHKNKAARDKSRLAAKVKALALAA